MIVFLTKNVPSNRIETCPPGDHEPKYIKDSGRKNEKLKFYLMSMSGDLRSYQTLNIARRNTILECLLRVQEV